MIGRDFNEIEIEIESIDYFCKNDQIISTFLGIAGCLYITTPLVGHETLAKHMKNTEKAVDVLKEMLKKNMLPGFILFMEWLLGTNGQPKYLEDKYILVTLTMFDEIYFKNPSVCLSVEEILKKIE